jgi:hypothetical protein
MLEKQPIHLYLSFLLIKVNSFPTKLYNNELFGFVVIVTKSDRRIILRCYSCYILTKRTCIIFNSNTTRSVILDPYLKVWKYFLILRISKAISISHELNYGVGSKMILIVIFETLQAVDAIICLIDNRILFLYEKNILMWSDIELIAFQRIFQKNDILCEVEISYHIDHFSYLLKLNLLSWWRYVYNWYVRFNNCVDQSYTFSSFLHLLKFETKTGEQRYLSILFFTNTST